MDEVELIYAVTASVAQETQRRVAYVRPMSEFAANVGIEGGATDREKANIATLLPLQVVISIQDARDEARLES